MKYLFDADVYVGWQKMSSYENMITVALLFLVTMKCTEQR